MDVRWKGALDEGPRGISRADDEEAIAGGGVGQVEVEGANEVDGVGCNIPRLNRINSILIPPSCNFFFGSPPAKNSGLSVLGLKQFQNG
jgi:hypothetical protein